MIREPNVGATYCMVNRPASDGSTKPHFRANPWQASDVEHQLSALIVPVPEAEPMIGR
jgi:hypothetical protein